MIEDVKFHLPVVDPAFRGNPVSAAVVLTVGGDHGGYFPLIDFPVAFNLQKTSFPVRKKMPDHAGVEPHGFRNEPVVNKAFVVGDVRVDAEAGGVDKIPVVDPDDVCPVNAGSDVLGHSPVKIVSGAGRDKGKNIVGVRNVVQQAVDGSVAADGCQDMLRISVIFPDRSGLLRRFIDPDFKIPVHFPGNLLQFPDQFVGSVLCLKPVYNINVLHGCLFLFRFFMPKYDKRKGAVGQLFLRIFRFYVILVSNEEEGYVQ